jgi:MOSC domain-containing protein YiiM
MLRRLNLDGDKQADLTVHGGVDKAVYPSGPPSQRSLRQPCSILLQPMSSARSLLGVVPYM